MRGRAGFVTWMVRVQPHGQPKLGVVNVPYTSSTVKAYGRPGTGTAEWDSAHSSRQPPSAVPHRGRFSTGVNSLSFNDNPPAGIRPAATSLVSSTRKCP